MPDLDELNWEAPRCFLIAVRARTLAGAARAAGLRGVGFEPPRCRQCGEVGAAGNPPVACQVLAHRKLSLVYPRELRANESVRKVATVLMEAMRSRAGRISGTK